MSHHQLSRQWSFSACSFCFVAMTFLLAANAPATMFDAVQGAYHVSFYGEGDSDANNVEGVQDWTTEQIDDVLDSVGVWTSKIGNTPNPNRKVELHVFWGTYSDLTLGQSFNPVTSVSGCVATAATYTEQVYRERKNLSLAAGQCDAYIILDNDGIVYNGTTYLLNFGEDVTPYSKIDFRNIVTHEIGHCLGFVSNSIYNTNTKELTWRSGLTAWDQLLRDSSGNAPAANGTGTPGNFNQVDNPVYFVGENAVAANDGDDVAVYAPSGWEGGSSLCHVNESTFPNELMGPNVSNGPATRSPTDLEWAIMKDLGWTIVPEPGTLVMLIGGGLVSLVWFSRKRRGGC